MMRILTALIAAFFFVTFGTNTRAQSPDDVVWVQIEAHPSLAAATDRARAYTTLLADVNGFSLGGSWYGIAVGPYRRADAEAVLQQYVRDGLVPGDSFVQLSNRLRQQFWPVGANVLNRGVIELPETVTAPASPTTQPTTQPLSSLRSQR